MIVVKRKIFKCHSLILKSRSPVFASMLKHRMKQSQTRNVHINDADPIVFRQFLLYIYSSDKRHLNWQNVKELYKLADKYMVNGLKWLCVNHMKNNLSKSNVIDFFELGQKHSDYLLIDAAQNFFLPRCIELVASTKWMKFLKRNPTDANKLIMAICHLTVTLLLRKRHFWTQKVAYNIKRNFAALWKFLKPKL